MSESSVKYCPCCGHENILVKSRTLAIVECANCGLCMMANTEELAISKWNKRTQIDVIVPTKKEEPAKDVKTKRRKIHRKSPRMQMVHVEEVLERPKTKSIWSRLIGRE